MRRSKVLLSSMIERFLKMDNGYHNVYLVEVIYTNIINYAKTHGLHIFDEEKEAMQNYVAEARMDAYLNRGKMKPSNWWDNTKDTTDYGPPNHPYYDRPDDEQNDYWFH
jgi:hypothetical protein